MSFFIGFAAISYGMFLIILGLNELVTGRSQTSRNQVINQQSRSTTPTRKTPSPSRPLQEPRAGVPGQFAGARPGAEMTYLHPLNGETRSTVIGTIKYTELWQRRKSPSEPWVPTGNLFTAHWLNNRTLIYEWKGNLRLLDELEPVTDVQIKQHFLAPAKRFGQSDETALVNFAYPPGSWLILDIGKFQVHQVWGSGLRLNPNATGRFIHAQGDTGLEGRSLVVEDYLEGQGGQDTVWRGWQIEWDKLVKITP